MKKYIFGVRHLQYFLMFLLIFINYGMRQMMSVAIIAMTSENSTSSEIQTFPDWTKTNIILTSFQWGYIVFQIPAGILAERYGAKWILLITVAITSAFNVVTPVVAVNFGEDGVIICRIICGLSQGFLFPCLVSFLSRWCPESERTFLTTCIYSAMNFASFSLPLTALLADTKLGWPLAFYFFSGLGLAWILIYSWLGSNTPREDSRISDKEKFYIENNVKKTSGFVAKSTPWRAIITSLPCWALLLVQMSEGYNMFLLYTQIPMYLYKIMGFDIKQNGFLSTLPQLTTWSLGLILSPIADMLIRKKKLSATRTRKIFQVTSCFLPAACLVWLGFLGKGQGTLGIIILVLAVGSTAGCQCGWAVNHIDMAPNYAGSLFAVTNCIATITSTAAPLSLDFFGGNKDDPLMWKKVFGLSSGFLVLTGLFYAIFASGEVQPWNNKICSKKDCKRSQKDHQEVYIQKDAV